MLDLASGKKRRVFDQEQYPWGVTAAAFTPDDTRVADYEALLADAQPQDFHVDDENLAASMCYTSGTTGNPKGVVYSHR